MKQKDVLRRGVALEPEAPQVRVPRLSRPNKLSLVLVASVAAAAFVVKVRGIDGGSRARNRSKPGGVDLQEGNDWGVFTGIHQHIHVFSGKRKGFQVRHMISNNAKPCSCQYVCG